MGCFVMKSEVFVTLLLSKTGSRRLLPPGWGREFATLCVVLGMLSVFVLVVVLVCLCWARACKILRMFISALKYNTVSLLCQR